MKAPVPECDTDGFVRVLTWMLQNLEFAIADLAGRAHMSSRTFARRFAEEVGTSPLRRLTEQRVLAAQSPLESTDLGADEVARQVGFSSATLLRHHFATTSPPLRHHFAAIVGITPNAFRTRFGTAS